MKKGEILFIFLLGFILILSLNSVLGSKKTICPSNCDYDTLTTCLVAANNTNNTCVINTSNQDYVLNWTFAEMNFTPDSSADASSDVLIFLNAVSNITIDLNNSIINGTNMVGVGIFSPTGNNNITIKNVNCYGFDECLHISGSNITIINVTARNSTSKNIHLANENSINITLRDSNSFNSGGYGIYINAYGTNITLINVNSSNNDNLDLATHNSAKNIIVRNSYFYNSLNAHCVSISAADSIFVNNTIKNCLKDDTVGLLVSTNGNTLIENNTFYNNNINLAVYASDVYIRNNIFNISYDANYAGTGLGGNVLFIDGDGVGNISFFNNTIENSFSVGLLVTNLLGSGNILNINISGNKFKNTTADTHNFDLWLYPTGGFLVNNTNIWLNSFYRTWVEDNATSTNYCVGNEGNFYNESITRINETDCGLVNITQPDGLNKIINGSYNIQWRKQSSINIINYTLWYRSANASAWTFLGSNTSTTYTWSLSSVNDSNDYLIKIVPNDGYMNGTNDNSTRTFTIDNANPDIILDPSTDTGLDLGATKTIICTGTDGLGVASTSLTVGGSSDGISCSASSCTDSYRMSTSNSKTVSCIITDNSGRTNSKSIILSFLGSSGGGSSGGGGGGSSEQVNVPVTEEKPASTSQAVGETFNIVIDGTDYEAKIIEINIISMKANIAGKEIGLVIGETKELDLNDDGKNDILVTLDGIKDKKVELSIKLKEQIIEEKPQEITKEKVTTFYSSVYNAFNQIYKFFSNLISNISTFIYNLIIK